ncbi:M28 family peptidase, partial [Longispora fulva]|uniref:M28 family peptidase n=2 Tax=Bacteria TaxID=2 RepID=UPI003636BC67
MKYFFKAVYVLLLTVSVACSVEKESPDTAIDTEQLVEDLKVLSSDEMEGRETATEGNSKAREYVIKRFKEEGAKPFEGKFIHEFTFLKPQTNEQVTGQNIIGVVPGKTDEILVISAHYDHVGIEDGEVYNGADDNASGTAALIAIIGYFSQNQPEHTLVFAAFDAE